MAHITADQGATVQTGAHRSENTFRQALHRFWKAFERAQTFNALNRLSDDDLKRLGVKRKDLGKFVGLEP